MQNGPISNGYVDHKNDRTKSKTDGDICNGNAVMDGIQWSDSTEVRLRQTSKESRQNTLNKTTSEEGNNIVLAKAFLGYLT